MTEVRRILDSNDIGDHLRFHVAPLSLFPREIFCTKTQNQIIFYLPAGEVSREVANLSERKNLHTPVYGVKEFVRPSVTLYLKITVQWTCTC